MLQAASCKLVLLRGWGILCRTAVFFKVHGRVGAEMAVVNAVVARINLSLLLYKGICASQALTAGGGGRALKDLVYDENVACIKYVCSACASPGSYQANIAKYLTKLGPRAMQQRRSDDSVPLALDTLKKQAVPGRVQMLSLTTCLNPARRYHPFAFR